MDVELLSLGAAAREAGVSYWTAQRWAVDGRAGIRLRTIPITEDGTRQRLVTRRKWLHRFLQQIGKPIPNVEESK